MIEREIGEIIYSNLNEWVDFDSTSLMLSGGVWRCTVRLTSFVVEIEYDIVKRLYKVSSCDGKRDIKLSRSGAFRRDVRRLIQKNGLDMGSFMGHVEAIAILIKERLSKNGKMSELTRKYRFRFKKDGIKIK